MSINEAGFAARISSIERFTGNSPVRFVQEFKELLGHYLKTDEVIGILNGDPGYESLHQLLQRAIDLAGAETDQGIGRMNKGRNLSSVFSRLSITDQEPKRDEFFRYNLNPLTPQNAFPHPPFEETDNRQLLNEFYREMNELSEEDRPKNYHAFITCFDRISRKYMWCLTASDYEGEDISLYDFMKVTEAIMVCLVRCADKEHPFTLVMGDFSGIQKYIFAIASQKNTGVAKRLRARSFYVDIVNIVFSHYIADCFHVEQANILLQSGGKFYCIVPTLDNVNDLLNDIRNEFDQSLFEIFHGFVSVNLAWLSCTDEEIKTYSDSITRLNELLGGEKSAPFENVLKSNDTWNSSRFVLYNDLAEKHICETCGMELVDKGKSSCRMCEMQLEIGKLLPSTKYIVFTKDGGANVYRIFKNYGIKLLPAVQENEIKGAYLIEALNDAEIGEIRQYPCTVKYMLNHIPRDEGEPKDFNEIAQSGQGIEKLAVLKADVDVLGFLFAQGLRIKKRHFGTISRVNTMSRMLEVFFCGYTETLLRENADYRDVYSVFSGGDDLFLVGPWNVMLDLALDIQKKFAEFTAKNKSITLSAAVSIFGPKEHIAYMADYSEEQLEHAKKGKLFLYDEREHKLKTGPELAGRNSICALGDLFTWEDFKKQLQYAGKIADMLENGRVSVGIVRRIIRYSSMYRQFLLTHDTCQLMFAPMFYYDRERNYNLKLNDRDDSWFMNQYISSMENAGMGQTVNKNLYFAETTIKIAMDKTRRERN